MKDIENIMLDIGRMLERSQDEILKTKREHHTSWDNHILTLSMAAIGFSFTFLPFKDGEYFWLFVVSLFSFILAIIFTTVNYVIASIGLESAIKDNIGAQVNNKKIIYRIFAYRKAISNLSEKENKQEIDDESSACWNDIESIMDSDKADEVEKKLNNNNAIITFLNNAKTISFIGGVLFVVIFSLFNLDKFN